MGAMTFEKVTAVCAAAEPAEKTERTANQPRIIATSLRNALYIKKMPRYFGNDASGGLTAHLAQEATAPRS